MKKNRSPRKSETHFEQVPVEVVKKIAGGDDGSRERAGTDNVIVERASRKSEPRTPRNGR
jgi:hypothetical protein